MKKDLGFLIFFVCLHELHPRVIKNLLWQTRVTLVPFSVVVSGCLAGLWQHPRRSGGDSGGRRRDHRREWEAGQGEDKSGGGEDDTSCPGTLGATVNNSTVTVHSCFELWTVLNWDGLIFTLSNLPCRIFLPCNSFTYLVPLNKHQLMALSCTCSFVLTLSLTVLYNPIKILFVWLYTWAETRGIEIIKHSHASCCGFLTNWSKSWVVHCVEGTCSTPLNSCGQKCRSMWPNVTVAGRLCCFKGISLFAAKIPWLPARRIKSRDSSQGFQGLACVNVRSAWTGWICPPGLWIELNVDKLLSKRRCDWFIQTSDVLFHYLFISLQGEATIHYNKLQADPKQGKSLDIGMPPPQWSFFQAVCFIIINAVAPQLCLDLKARFVVCFSLEKGEAPSGREFELRHGRRSGPQQSHSVQW